MTKYKDQGLKKAAKQSKTPQLPSNFTYRMMKRIGEEMYLREKRQEKRLFILMIITVMLMTGGCLGMIIWMYGEEISEGLHASVNNLPAFITPFLSSDADCTTFTENFRPLVKT